VRGRGSSSSAKKLSRAHHAGDLIPGKFLPNSIFGSHCHVSYGGQEITKDEFEVLMNTGFKWVAASDGFVPENAVVGGHSLSGETFYVGRAMHNGQNTPGKISKRSKCVYVPFGEEFTHKEYEVLVQVLQAQPVSNHRSSGELKFVTI
jgi:hypothetical protein